MSEPTTSPRSRAAVRQSWVERLERFDTSGLPVLDFCRAEAVSTQSFYYWRNKLLRAAGHQPGGLARADAPQFLPVRLQPAAPVELALPGGATLRLQPGCDLAFVRSLLQALTERPC